MLLSRQYMLPDTTLASPVPQEQMQWQYVVSEDVFLHTLRQTSPIYIEPNHGIGIAPDLYPIPHSPALVLSLTTLTCYRAPVAMSLSTALEHHYTISQRTTIAIRTAIHEALTNAVIHGNLGMQERFRGMQAFKAYHTRILSLLEDPDYALKRIIITVFHTPAALTVRIHDEGDGYIEPTPKLFSDELPLGKGLILIRKHSVSVRVLEGGRTIEMDFTLP